MKIAFVGDYLPDYNRTAIIHKGLKALGHEVIEFSFKKKNRKAKQKIKELVQECDLFFMPSFTHQQVGFVKGIVKNKKPLIFDPLISRYLTKVHDYKLVPRFSFSALRNYYRDKLPMQTADFVVTDTEQHRQYFHSQFSIPLDKMGVLYIGNDFDEFYPAKSPVQNSDDVFHVGFYGGFIPLQGVMNILQAVNFLSEYKDIHFELIGNGFQYLEALDYIKDHQLQNVSTPGWLKPNELREKIQAFDMALGIFGDTEKSHLVIPNKVYHYTACGIPTLTQDTKAIREVFENEKDILLCSPEPEDIAKNILLLKTSKDKRQALGKAAYKKMHSNYNSKCVAKKLIEYANKLL